MTCHRQLARTAVSLFLTGVLSACGGGDAGGPGVVPDVNTKPQPIVTAVADSVTLSSSGAITIAVLTNDTVTLNGEIRLDRVTAPANGSAYISGNTIVYTPAPGFAGTDSFTYTIMPSVINAYMILHSTATVTVTVPRF